MAHKYCVVLGDSIMCTVSGGVANQHALSLIQNEKDVFIKNMSTGGNALGAANPAGYNNSYMTSVLDNMGGFMAIGVDVIIVQAGTNDHGLNINWGDTYNSLVRILTWARSKGKKVLVLDPIWKENEDTPNASGFTLNTYRYFMAYATSQFTDCAWFAHRENTILGTSAGASYFEPTEAPNRTHLTAAGQRKYADWIKVEAASAGFF